MMLRLKQLTLFLNLPAFFICKDEVRRTYKTRGAEYKRYLAGNYQIPHAGEESEKVKYAWYNG